MEPRCDYVSNSLHSQHQVSPVLVAELHANITLRHTNQHIQIEEEVKTNLLPTDAKTQKQDKEYDTGNHDQSPTNQLPTGNPKLHK